MIDIRTGDMGKDSTATLELVLINSDGSDFPTEWKATPQGSMAVPLINEGVVVPGSVIPVAIDRERTVLFAAISFRRAAKREWFEVAMMEAVNHAFTFNHDRVKILRPSESSQLQSLELIWGDGRVPSVLEIWSPQ